MKIRVKIKEMYVCVCVYDEALCYVLYEFRITPYNCA